MRNFIRNALIGVVASTSFSCYSEDADFITLGDVVRQAAKELALERHTSPGAWRYYGAIPECSTNPVKSVKLLMLMNKYGGIDTSQGPALPCTVNGSLEKLYVPERTSPSSDSKLYDYCKIKHINDGDDAAYSPLSSHVDYGQIFVQSRSVIWECVLSHAPDRTRLVSSADTIKSVGTKMKDPY